MLQAPELNWRIAAVKGLRMCGYILAWCAVLLSSPPSFGAQVRPVNREFQVEDCGTPIEVLRLVASTVYRHPDSGELHLFLEYGNNNGYGIGEQEWEDTAHRFVDVELDSGAMRRCRGGRPGGITTQHFFHPNGRMVLFETKTRPATLSEYDSRAGEYRTIGALGNTAYKVVLTPAGRIYAGEVTGDVTVYDPAVRKLTRYDRPAGRDIHWGVYTMEVEEPWVYCGMTDHGKWWLTVIDTRSGTSRSFFDVGSGQPPAKGSGHSVVRTEAGNIFFGSYRLKDGTPLMDDAGAPVPLATPDKSERLEGNRPWSNMWRVSGYAGQRYTEARDALDLEFDLDQAEPDNWGGGVAVVRWRQAGEEPWRQVEVRGLPLVGTSPKCLAVAPDGTLVGVAQFYGSVFRFDPASGASTDVGTAPGSVYDILPLADRTYFCGYVAFLAEYLHDQPYAIDRKASFEDDGNPKRYRTVGKWTTCMVQGPDGKIYLGGKFGRHTTGGGLSIFDPRTKEMQTVREPFTHLAVVDLAPVNDGKTLAITTRPLGEGAPEKGSIFLFDFGSGRLGDPITLDIPEHPDQLFVAGDSSVIGVSRHAETDATGQTTHATLVYGVDLSTGELAFERQYPGRAFTGMCAYDRTPVVRGPDGCGWLFVDTKLCRIHPDGTLETVRDGMDCRGTIVWRGETLYLFNGGRVYSRLFPNVVRIPDLFE